MAKLSQEALAYLLHSHGSFLRSLQDMRGAGITHVKLLGSNDSEDCEACRAADGAAFTIDTVPELPLAACQCQSKYGCRVIVVADDRSKH